MSGAAQNTFELPMKTEKKKCLTSKYPPAGIPLKTNSKIRNNLKLNTSHNAEVNSLSKWGLRLRQKSIHANPDFFLNKKDNVNNLLEIIFEDKP